MQSDAARETLQEWILPKADSWHRPLKLPESAPFVSNVFLLKPNQKQITRKSKQETKKN
jgi:hypothetical protein